MTTLLSLITVCANSALTGYGLSALTRMMKTISDRITLTIAYIFSYHHHNQHLLEALEAHAKNALTMHVDNGAHHVISYLIKRESGEHAQGHWRLESSDIEQIINLDWSKCFSDKAILQLIQLINSGANLQREALPFSRYCKQLSHELDQNPSAKALVCSLSRIEVEALDTISENLIHSSETHLSNHAISFRNKFNEAITRIKLTRISTLDIKLINAHLHNNPEDLAPDPLAPTDKASKFMAIEVSEPDSDAGFVSASGEYTLHPPKVLALLAAYAKLAKPNTRKANATFKFLLHLTEKIVIPAISLGTLYALTQLLHQGTKHVFNTATLNDSHFSTYILSGLSALLFGSMLLEQISNHVQTFLYNLRAKKQDTQVKPLHQVSGSTYRGLSWLGRLVAVLSFSTTGGLIQQFVTSGTLKIACHVLNLITSYCLYSKNAMAVADALHQHKSEKAQPHWPLAIRYRDLQQALQNITTLPSSVFRPMLLSSLVDLLDIETGTKHTQHQLWDFRPNWLHYSDAMPTLHRGDTGFTSAEDSTATTGGYARHESVDLPDNASDLIEYIQASDEIESDYCHSPQIIVRL